MLNELHEGNEAASSGRPRRERLERIANAERDRRAGRIGMAIAAIGEPMEWPARVVMALGQWPDSEGQAAREMLEEGLDLWARDLSLGSLSEDSSDPVTDSASPDALSRPIEAAELDLAFESAEAEVESMNDVNSVAERILAEEPTGLAELTGEVLAGPTDAGLAVAIEEAVEAPQYAPITEEFDIGIVESASPRTSRKPSSSATGSASNARQQLSTLEGWLSNIQRRVEHGQARRTA